MSTGWDTRLKILQDDAERMMLAPLREHNWTIHEVKEYEAGEYLIVDVERGGYRHKVALLYTSGTANAVYKRLAAQVEHIFLHGEKYKLESYAYGIKTPIDELADFHDVLVRWNQESAPGKFAPDAPPAVARTAQADHLHLLSETPIDAIWLRLRQLTSVTLASKLVASRASGAGVQLNDAAMRRKAEGLSFALRNATDYFHGAGARNVSQRVLNLYYGSMAFVFAEMLASPNGTTALGEIEEATKYGHGLYSIDGEKDDLEHLVVGVLATGLFPKWMRFLGLDTTKVPAKKPKVHADLATQPALSWVTIEQLFARIPEIADLYSEVFDGPPAWAMPYYDVTANKQPSFRNVGKPRPSRSYVQFTDESGRLTKEDIANLPGPISEISEASSNEPGRHFRVAVDHPGKEFWHEVVPLHHSPFIEGALIMPLYGSVTQFRAICVALLYALSIVVRYRPSIWRRVQEGDLDHVRALIEAFLAVVERVLPQEFLEQVSGQRIFAAPRGTL